MMIIRAKDKERLISILESATTPLEVWAYGSRVNGSAHEGSDLDLVIRTPNLEKLPFGVFSDLKEKIQNCNIPIVIELHDWARLPESFQENIKSHYEVLFSNSKMILNEPSVEYKKQGNN